MRTTIDINQKLLREAQRLMPARSKKSLVDISLKELVRKGHLRRLAGRLGRTAMISGTALLKARRRG